MLGKLEELTLLAALRAGDNALPSQIYECLVDSAESGDRTAAFGAVYTTLSRMARKKLVSEQQVFDQQGRSRKGYSVTGVGRRAIVNSISRLRELGGFALTGAMI